MITALLAVLCFGISDALWKPSIKIHGHYKLLLHRTILTSIILLLYFLVTNTNELENMSMFLMAILSGAISGMGLYFLTRAFILESTSTVLFLNIFTLVFSQLSAMILFDEKVQLGSYTIQIGLCMITVCFLNNLKIKLNKGLTYGILASLCFGIAYPLAGIPIKVIGYQATILSQELTILIFLIGYGWFQKKLKIDFKSYKDPKLILLSLLATSAIILFFYSYNKLEIYKVNLISSFHPVGGMLISIFLFREQPTKYQFIGVTISFLTTLLIYLH